MKKGVSKETVKVKCQGCGQDDYDEETNCCGNEFTISTSKIKTRTKVEEEPIYTYVHSKAYLERSKLSRAIMMPCLKYSSVPTGQTKLIQITERYIICPICGNYVVIYEDRKEVQRKSINKKPVWRQLE